MHIKEMITDKIIEAIKTLYDQFVSPNQIILQKTKQEFEGDITLLVFPLTKISKKSPEETASAIGNFLKENLCEIKSFNVVKGFLNLVITDEYWVNYLSQLTTSNWPIAGSQQPTASHETVMIEYSSPNTNKPLHLGHIRNNLLGHSLAEILKANGKKVIRVNLVNDRGIHICKSMLAWKKWGNGETPQSSGMKGDHLVGKYYVEFDRQLKLQISNANSQEEIQNAPLMKEARELLSKWEAGDKEIVALWKMLNSWVYDGFEKTYRELGIEFDKTYYESETYLLGKKIVEEGLQKNIFKKKDDGSVWIDLTADGLDEKVLLRADGTSVYITQDIGTAIERLKEFTIDKMIYVVGDEQDYHFKVLFTILKKIQEHKIIPSVNGQDLKWASFYHLSYGMVDLPSGKMKSREGTVVDADDLIAEMKNTARTITKELGKTEGMSDKEIEELEHIIGLGALKYFILKVEPKKRMLFDPKESIDFNGNTGPFIQYTYARIKSVLRKANHKPKAENLKPKELLQKEKNIIKLIHDFPEVIKKSADEYNPALIANYVYELAKEYNGFYQEIPILKAKKEEEKEFRLVLSEKTAEVIKTSLHLLGIQVPERM
jgi:arginyl-tRNA synthetase